MTTRVATVTTEQRSAARPPQGAHPEHPDPLEHLIDLEAIRLAPSPRAPRLLAGVLLATLVVAGLALAILPWQQSAPGKGKVVAYSPVERQQTVEAPIEGRVVRLAVREGSRVKAGDLLADLTDNDPQILTRLAEERDAVAARIEAARARADSIASRIDQLGSSRERAMSAASRRVEMARQRVSAAARALDAARAAEGTAHLNLERLTALHGQGLRSTRDLELAQLDEARAQSERDRALAALESARAEELALGSEQLKVATDGAAAIDDARAGRAAAQAEVASAAGELARIQVRLARQESQQVRAPRDGTVLRLASQQGEMVKAGDPLAVLVPDAEARAVELWVDGNDVPLIGEGAEARLQFEGWPAVQFTGWPSVAVGTFAGQVTLVDATDDGKGRFRVLVVPREGEAWPSGQYLRQGTQASGWVLLGRVKLGYELWRRFNGFPPAASAPPADGDGSTQGANQGAKKK